MPITAQYAPISSPSAGDSAPIPITWPFAAPTDIVVKERTTATGAETVETAGVDYSITWTPTGGSVNPLRLRVVGTSWIVERSTDITQPSSLRNGGPYNPETVENVLNRSTLQIQELREEVPAFPEARNRTAGAPLVFNGAGGVSNGSTIGTGDMALRGDLAIEDEGFGVELVAGAVSQAGEQTITGAKLFDTAAAYTELRRDASPLNYAGTRAGFVMQHRDTGSGSASELAPGAVFQFTTTGNGVVNSGTETSQSIWLGAFFSQNKTGDGSAHCATGIGQLGAVGAGGYNELGLFQGEVTNVGSVLGTLSGVEMLLKDSPDAGATSYSSRMQAVIGRIAKFNATGRVAYNFFATSEGTQAVDAVLGVSAAGFKTWKYGIDLSPGTYTTGQAILLPNNTSIAAKRAGGVVVPLMFLSGADNLLIPMPTTATSVAICTTGLANRLEVDNDATNAVLVWVDGAMKRLLVGAPDSDGAGFRKVRTAN